LVSAKPVAAPTGQADPVGKEDAQLHGLIDQLHQLITTLRNERAFLETVLHQMPAGVIIAEAPSGRLTMGNDEVEKIWGGPFRPSKSVEEYGQWIGFHADGRRYEPHEWPIARAIRRGEIVLGEEIRIRRFDELEATVLVDLPPQLDRWLGLGRDRIQCSELVESTRGPGGGYSLGRKADQITVADIIVAVDEPIDATGCLGKENCMGEDTGRCMTHDLWANLNQKMIEYLDSISLRKLVDEQLAKGVAIEEAPIKRAISNVPVVKPIKVTAPNSVFALGSAMSK